LARRSNFWSSEVMRFLLNRWPDGICSYHGRDSGDIAVMVEAPLHRKAKGVRLRVESQLAAPERCDDLLTWNAFSSTELVIGYVERCVQTNAAVVIEVVLDSGQLDLGAFGQVGGLV